MATVIDTTENRDTASLSSPTLHTDNGDARIEQIFHALSAYRDGDLSKKITVDVRGEVAELKDNVNTMIKNLRETTERNMEQDWLKTNLAKFAGMLQGQRDLFTVGQMLLSELTPLVNAQQGAIYQMETEPEPSLRLLAGYTQPYDQPERITLGAGLVGQCAIEKQSILLKDVPRDYTKIHSSLGEASPTNIVVLPALFEGETKAVIELASLRPFPKTYLTFLEQLRMSIGVVFNTIEATMRTENVLQQSQQLTSEPQAQQKELQQTNEELAEKAKQLAEQNVEVERKNKEVEQARRALEEKAAELALTSKYKSEFLANMSHELRTPLNSILILGQQLAENAAGNLTPKQVELARNIYSAGSDLLALINDILDLSKIESGTVTVESEEITFTTLRETVERNFRHVAESKNRTDTKNLPLYMEFDPDLPHAFITDPKRLQQILKNLLSNAFKFTAAGHVSMRVRMATEGWTPDHPVLSRANSAIAISITDTGIGIAPDKQRIIFEAFQQADAGASRKYGGTGLGLAISRELANLLGGEIRLVSNLNQGSTFTLYLPLAYMGPIAESMSIPVDSQQQAIYALPVAKEEIIQDDREIIQDGDLTLLIVEDDPHYARVLLGLARDKGFKGIVAMRGQQAIKLARQYHPTAITLDILLPDMLGWTVLNSLKIDPTTRHIPVQIISLEAERQHGLSHGAFSYLVKPVTTDELEQCFDRIKTFVTPHLKRLLIVEDNKIESESIGELLAHDDLEIRAAGTGREALQMLLDEPFDCCVLAQRMLEKNNFHVTVECEDGSEPDSEEARFLLFECARELLFNAFKHAGVDAARVRLRFVEGDRVQVIVEDDGNGFDLEEVRTRTRNTFGLFSIQQRLEHLGGRMDIASSPCNGTRIVLTSPAQLRSTETERVTAAPQHPAQSVAPARVSSSNIGVLIVDDHRIVRQGLAALLRTEPDFEVVGEADNGTTAVELAEKLHPDVILILLWT